ncbi:hypothetical protein H0G86_003607 [Trichoderma simmonsii]|uniref:Uncharacterized protein n=1 Tax=Trichoderma simmonsii TaxID=1491479 RepID=A0A8G0L8X9_9HYPO|nr:hypothetical protein H0G86_003607 [Trichoderma simmonsii]
MKEGYSVLELEGVDDNFKDTKAPWIYHVAIAYPSLPGAVGRLRRRLPPFCWTGLGSQCLVAFVAFEYPQPDHYCLATALILSLSLTLSFSFLPSFSSFSFLDFIGWFGSGCTRI